MKKIQYLLVICLFTTATILFFTGCQDDPNPEDLPVATIGVVNVSKQSGTIRMQLEALEGLNPTAILDWGICTNDNIDPTIDDHVLSLGSGIFFGSKILKIRDLGITEPGNYSLRVYATNSYGSAYSANYSLPVEEEYFIPYMSLHLTTTLIQSYVSPQCGPNIIEAGIYVSENPGVTTSNYYYSVMDRLNYYDQSNRLFIDYTDILDGSSISISNVGDHIYYKGYVKNSDGVEVFTEEEVYTKY